LANQIDITDSILSLSVAKRRLTLAEVSNCLTTRQSSAWSSLSSISLALIASSKDAEPLVCRRLFSSALTLGARFTFFHELERECGAERDVEKWTGALSVDGRWAVEDGVAAASETVHGDPISKLLPNYQYVVYNRFRAC